MWNYNLIIPEFVIISTFLIFYFTQPRLPIKLHKAFLFILIIDISTLLMDVLSAASIEFWSIMTPFALRLENTIYFFVFIQRIICFVMFTNIILQKDMRFSVLRKVVYIFPFFLMNLLVFSNLFVDSIFIITEDGEYAKGPLYFTIYVCAFYYLAACFFFTFKNIKKLTPGEYIPIIVYNLVLTCGYIFRILFPQYLLMNFFTLITIIIIYLSFENPALFKEEKSGTFNQKALITLLNEIKREHYPLIMGFAINNYSELREIHSTSQMDRCLGLIGLYLKQTFPDLLVFYLRDGRFIIVGKKIMEADIIRTYIQQRFDNAWSTDDIDMLLEIDFIQVDSQIVPCENELLFKVITYAFNENEIHPIKERIITTEDIKTIERNSQIKRAVEYAVDHNSVELFLQPVFDAKTNKLIGAESLSRIKDENGNYISPSLFIPIAEKNGRINKLGEQRFEKTCRFIKENDINAMGLSWINVNLSPIQILRRDLNKRFSTILQKYGISPEKIHLEITEESMIDFDFLDTQMKSMNNSGFCFVLDDYGKGYSNVARMKKCPFINVKLDMEFVWDYMKDQDKILPTLVQTIKLMGFTVTAEGIENQEIADAMKEIGCDYLQGFCFSKPLPAKEFAEKYGFKRIFVNSYSE